MKILIAAEYFPPVAPGGAEWSIYYLAQALAERGHQVALATVSHGPTPHVPDGVECHAMWFPFHLSEGQKIHRQGVLENPLFHAAFTAFLFRVSRKFNPDVIHSQTKNAVVAAVGVGKLRGIPIVHTLRDIGIACPFGMCFINGEDVETCSFGRCAFGSCSGYLIEHYTKKKLKDRIVPRVLGALLWPDTRLKQWCLSQATELISPSRGLLEALPARFRNSKFQWNIVPHLPPPEKKASPIPISNPALNLSSKRFVLYLGKLSRGKGIHLLEDAIRRLQSAFPEVQFVFAGKGEWTFAPDLPIRSLGSLPHADALELMKKAECVVVPSVVPEAYNRVVLEAMSVGTPVVVAASGSMAEQVEHGVTGLVARRGSVEELTQCLSAVLSDSELKKRLGEQGKRAIQSTVSRDAVLQNLEDLYHRCESQTGTVRWRWLNRLARIYLNGVTLFNDKAKRLAIHLVKWTGKSTQKIHPKHLLEKEDFYSWHLPYLRPEDDVLDIGAGAGTHTLTAAEQCRSAVGIELDPTNLAICRRRAEERGLKNIRFLDCNAENKLPFEDGLFSAVLLLDVIEHLHKRDQLLTEIARVLRPGGRLMLTAPNRQTPWKIKLKSAGLFYYADRDHKIEYTVDEIKEELGRNGFRFAEPPRPVVIDTPWVGLIDILGGFSLSLYRKLSIWKVKQAQLHPERSNGFLIVAERVAHLSKPMQERRQDAVTHVQA